MSSVLREPRLAERAVLAGAGHLKDLAKDPDEAQNNLARDLLRKAVRHSRWPGLYLADIPMMNPSNNKAYVTKLSFLLPHESIHALLKVNRAQDLQSGLTPQFFQQRPDLECLTLSVLGLKDFRLPICCFPKRYMHKPKTYDSIFRIIAWSMRCLLTNVLPTAPHDGNASEASDAYRQRLLRGGSAVGCTAVIAEFRGDWSMFKEVLDVPSWSSTYICWLCQARKTDCKNAQATATWRCLCQEVFCHILFLVSFTCRLLYVLKDIYLYICVEIVLPDINAFIRQQRLSHMDFLLRQRRDGRRISTFFSIPGCLSDTIKRDWLHVADLGVSQDWSGSFLYFIMEAKLPGSSRLDKCASLFAKGKRKSPKLRAKGGKMMELIDWILEVAEEHLMDRFSLEEDCVLQGCRRLAALYQLLRTENWNAREFQKHSMEFVLCFGALEDHFAEQRPGTKLFRVKPKAHLLQELALTGNNPSKQWTFRDEAFGHSFALLAKRRGGTFSAKAVSRAVLLRFLAGNPAPMI